MSSDNVSSNIYSAWFLNDSNVIGNVFQSSMVLCKNKFAPTNLCAWSLKNSAIVYSCCPMNNYSVGTHFKPFTISKIWIKLTLWRRYRKDGNSIIPKRSSYVYFWQFVAARGWTDSKIILSPISADPKWHNHIPSPAPTPTLPSHNLPFYTIKHCIPVRGMIL